MHEGGPAAEVQVELTEISHRPSFILDRGPFRPLQVTWARTNEQGYFDIELRSAGEYSLRAWSPELGEGLLKSVELDPASPPAALQLVIDRAPGWIAGNVTFPEGHGPPEVWLAVTGSGNRLMGIEEDGSFVLTGLPPGKQTVMLRKKFSKGDRPASTTISRKPNSDWVHFSHGPTRAPAWLGAEPTYEVLVKSGEEASLHINLRAKPTCLLEGRILINGKPPHYNPNGWGMYTELPPRVVLDRGRWDGYVSRCVLDEDGRFTLSAEEPGVYRLVIDVDPVEGADWQVLDSVELSTGKSVWSRDIEVGALTLNSANEDWRRLKDEVALRWRGPDELRVFMLFPVEDEVARRLSFSCVPAGAVQVYEDMNGKRSILGGHTIKAGETTVVD